MLTLRGNGTARFLPLFVNLCGIAKDSSPSSSSSSSSLALIQRAVRAVAAASVASSSTGALISSTFCSVFISTKLSNWCRLDALRICRMSTETFNLVSLCLLWKQGWASFSRAENVLASSPDSGAMETSHRHGAASCCVAFLRSTNLRAVKTQSERHYPYDILYLSEAGNSNAFLLRQ